MSKVFYSGIYQLFQVWRTRALCNVFPNESSNDDDATRISVPPTRPLPEPPTAKRRSTVENIYAKDDVLPNPPRSLSGPQAGKYGF